VAIRTRDIAKAEEDIENYKPIRSTGIKIAL